MVETVPSTVYKTIRSLNDVINCVRGRAKIIKDIALSDNEFLL